jgi:hypothetical protein
MEITRRRSFPYLQQVAGITAVNYRSEPTAWRIEKGCEVSEIFSCTKAGDTLSTPLLQAHVGDPVAIHVLGAFSEQVQLFTVDGHEWPHEPYMQGADQVSTMNSADLRSSTPISQAAQEVRNKIVGDYLWKNNARHLPMQGNGAFRSCRLRIRFFR